MVDFIADYYESIERYDVKSSVTPGYLAARLPAEAPVLGQPWSDIMRDVTEHILPGMTHWQRCVWNLEPPIPALIVCPTCVCVFPSPRFHAFFPAQTSFPAMLGDMLSGCFNAIGLRSGGFDAGRWSAGHSRGDSWIASPAMTELETVVMDWTASMLGLPAKFLSRGTGGGVIQGTASESALVAAFVARDVALCVHQGKSIGECCAYLTKHRHACFDKALRLSGIRHVRIVDDADGLQRAIQQVGWLLVHRFVAVRWKSNLLK